MKFGVFAPLAGPFATGEYLNLLGPAVEERGFDSLWTAEHVVLFDDYASQYPYAADGRIPARADAGILETFTSLAFLAAATRRVRLGTGICLLPQRNPVYTAKEAANVDWLSGGRLDPYTRKSGVASYSSVGHRVQGHAAGEAQRFGAGPLPQSPTQPQERLLGHLLQGCGDVGVVLVGRGGQVPGPARRPAWTQQALEPWPEAKLRVGHVREVGQPELEGAVGPSPCSLEPVACC